MLRESKAARTPETFIGHVREVSIHARKAHADLLDGYGKREGISSEKGTVRAWTGAVF